MGLINSKQVGRDKWILQCVGLVSGEHFEVEQWNILNRPFRKIEVTPRKINMESKNLHHSHFGSSVSAISDTTESISNTTDKVSGVSWRKGTASVKELHRNRTWTSNWENSCSKNGKNGQLKALRLRSSCTENEQREPPLLPGILKETNQQSAGLVREAVYGKAASIPNRYYFLTAKSIAEAQNIGYAVAATFAAVTALFSYSEVDNNTWRHNMWRTRLWGRDIPFFRLLAMVLWDSRAPRTCGNCFNHCSAMWNLLSLPIEFWIGYMQIPRAHQDLWTKGFWSGLYIGILLNLRPVDRKKASIETQLPGRTRSKSLANEKRIAPAWQQNLCLLYVSCWT